MGLCFIDCFCQIFISISTIFLFVFISPSSSNFAHHATYSTIYNTWLDFITTNIWFHYNIPYIVFIILKIMQSYSLLVKLFILSFNHVITSRIFLAGIGSQVAFMDIFQDAFWCWVIIIFIKVWRSLFGRIEQFLEDWLTLYKVSEKSYELFSRKNCSLTYRLWSIICSGKGSCYSSKHNQVIAAKKVFFTTRS